MKATIPLAMHLAACGKQDGERDGDFHEADFATASQGGQAAHETRLTNAMPLHKGAAFLAG